MTEIADLEAVLEGLFSSRVRRKVLALLVAPADAHYHARELAKLTGEHFNAVWQELKHLEALGVLVSAKSGNQVQYRANPAMPLIPDLRALLSRAQGQPAAAPAAAPPKAAGVRVSQASHPDLVMGETD